MSLIEFIFENFENVVVYDFEYKQTPGNNPSPVCCTFKELKSGKQETHWYLGQTPDWPYDNSNTLWICHNALFGIQWSRI